MTVLDCLSVMLMYVLAAPIIAIMFFFVAILPYPLVYSIFSVIGRFWCNLLASLATTLLAIWGFDGFSEGGEVSPTMLMMVVPLLVFLRFDCFYDRCYCYWMEIQTDYDPDDAGTIYGHVVAFICTPLLLGWPVW